MRDGYTLPGGMITTDAGLAAEQWAKAFYQVRDALERIRPIPSMILQRKTVRNLDEVYAECDRALSLGESK